MSERIFYIVVVLLFLFNGESFAQEKNVEKNRGIRQYQSIYGYSVKPKSGVVNYFKNLEKEALFSPVVSNPRSFLTLKSSPIFENGYYNQPVSFFCRQELKFEKATSIALRFRLGSVEYTDYLEQKPNAIKPR